jgi:hypothetical protein
MFQEPVRLFAPVEPGSNVYAPMGSPKKERPRSLDGGPAAGQRPVLGMDVGTVNVIHRNCSCPWCAEVGADVVVHEYASVEGVSFFTYYASYARDEAAEDDDQ